MFQQELWTMLEHPEEDAGREDQSQVPHGEHQQSNPSPKAIDPEVVFDLNEIYHLLYFEAADPPAQDMHLLTEPHLISTHLYAALPEVLWRVRALKSQVRPTGPILFKPFSPSIPREDQCGLCGALLHLEQDEHFRCLFCALAARLVLGYQTLTQWLLGPSS